MSVHVLRFVNENTYKIGPLSGGGLIVNVRLVFLGSPCQTKGFRFCFGPVWLYFGVSGGLRGSILGVLGLHFGTLGGPLASILGALGVS